MSSAPSATIVVPVRDEEKNVSLLLWRLSHALSTSETTEVLFVDDSDNDLTGRAVRRAADELERQNLLIVHHHRGEGDRTGLATAVVKGIELASSDRVVVMDGDLQHPPEMVPALLGQLEGGSAVVMASRYIPDGSAGGLNGAVRVLVSKASTFVAKAAFPRTLRRVTDPMTGFFAVKRDQLEIGTLKPRGFKILLELLGRHPHLSHAEVPLAFEERTAGQSKGSLKQGREYLLHLLQLRFSTLPKQLNFALGGGLIAVLGALLLDGMVRVGAVEAVAYAIQLAVTMALSFLYNYRVTWSGQPRAGLPRRMAWFAGTRAATQVISWFAFTALTHFGIGYKISYWLCLFGATAINYVTSDKLVFVESRGKTMTKETWRHLVQAASICAVMILALVLIWRYAHLALCIGLAAAAVFCLVLGSTETYWRNYSWWTPEAMDAFAWPEAVPVAFATLFFHIVVPALDEADNLVATVDQLMRQDHPHFEVVLSLCSCDTATIEAARRAEAIHSGSVRLVIGDHARFRLHRKARQLNTALATIPVEAKHLVMIADAEGGVQPALLRHMEAVFLTEDCDVVQGGVQLMNLTKWFQVFAAMEYKGWFEGNMARQATTGVVLFGGNTIAFTTQHLNRIGGIPDSLTEDGAAGIRSAAVGAKVAVCYSPELCTRELSPPTLFNKQLGSLFHQRVRWVQGYFAELLKGEWLTLPTWKERRSAGYGLASPVLQAISSVLLPLAIVTVLAVKVPLLLSLATFVPLVPYALTVWAQVMHLADFKRRFEQEVRIHHYLILIFMAPLYQIVLMSASAVAVWRDRKGHGDWYKTGRQHDETETALVSVEGAAA